MSEIIINEEEARQAFKASLMELCRDGRTKLLSDTDYIFNPDVEITQGEKDALMVYRQELRDFPAGFLVALDDMSDMELGSITPHSIEYPTKHNKGN